MDGGAPALRSSLLRLVVLELPFILGIAAGLALLGRRGHLFMATQSPVGFDWSEYLQAAWMVANGEDLGYPGFRNPLFPWMVGTLGGWTGSYPVAAVAISSIGTIAIVLSAGLGARALATSWAGGLAAWSVPFVYDTPLASRWVNLYPFLGGMTGLTVALGVCAARWPRAWLALAAGVAGGLAWGVDNRALPIVAVSAGLVVLGMARHQGGIRRWVLPVVFLAGAALGPISQRGLAVAEGRPMEEQMRLQRENDLRMILGSGTEALKRACRDEPRYETPSLSGLQRPCSRALLRYNLEFLPRRLPFGLLLTLVLTPLVWLPARRGWASMAAGVMVAAAAWGPLAFLSMWVMVPDRYVLQFAGVLAMLVPAGLSRAAETFLPGKTAQLGAAVLSVAGAWGVASRVDHGPPPTPPGEDGRYRALASLMYRVRREVGPGDVLLDCSAQGIETALLPMLYHSPPPSLTGTDSIRCLEWLEAPEPSLGDRWVVTGVRCPFEQPPPGSLEYDDPDLCARCFPVPGPSLDVPCPHGKKVGHCRTCRDARVSTDRWDLVQRYDSGYSCLDTLMLWRWKEGAE